MTANGQHAHLPWGRAPQGFSTAEEAVYPPVLCDKWAQLVRQAVRPQLSDKPINPEKRARPPLANRSRSPSTSCPTIARC